MKKVLYSLALLALMSVGACSQSGENKEQVADSVPENSVPGHPEQFMEDINAGEEPVSVAEEAEATDQSGIATMDDRAAAAVLADDNYFRPTKKVNRLTILDFNATWCGPCKQFTPAFEEVAEAYGNKADFYSVDTDANPETAKAFGIESIPCVVFIKPDGTIKKFVGTGDLLPAEKFEAIVKDYLN